MTTPATLTRCFGAENEKDEPTCDGSPVRTVYFLAPSADTWQRTEWCDDCRATAIGFGYETRTFVEHAFTCLQCNREARATLEAIAQTRADFGLTSSDADVADYLDFCLSCCTGEIVEGEHVAIAAKEG